MEDDIMLEEVEQVVGKMTLFEDEFMSMVFDKNIPATELLLRTILQNNGIDVIEVTGQKEFKSPLVGGRDIRLDIVAKDRTGRVFNAEIQRDSRGASEKRARFHSSMLDIRMLKASQDFKELKDSYVIFITEKDYFKQGLPVYTIERHIEETEEVFRDGSHILYVNGSYEGDDAIGRLMQDFRCKEVENMHYSEIAESVRHFKERGGMTDMSELVEEFGRKVAERVAKRTTVEDANEYGIEKEIVIDKLCRKYSLTREEAEQTYDKYTKDMVSVVRS